MVESTQKLPTSTGRLTPLASQQAENVIKGFSSRGATFFNFKQFQELTKGLPQDTRIVDILESLKRTK